MKKIKTLEKFVAQVQSEKILAELNGLTKIPRKLPPLRQLGYTSGQKGKRIELENEKTEGL